MQYSVGYTCQMLIWIKSLYKKEGKSKKSLTANEASVSPTLGVKCVPLLVC